MKTPARGGRQRAGVYGLGFPVEGFSERRRITVRVLKVKTSSIVTEPDLRNARWRRTHHIPWAQNLPARARDDHTFHVLALPAFPAPRLR